MRCRKPFRRGLIEFGCGQCMPCRIDRRRLWTHRLMLEAFEHPGASSFLTLTYADPAPVSLEPRELQLWLKRLRAELSPVKLRFLACGEYGEESLRPHYHAAVFGLPIPPDHGFSVVLRPGVSGKSEFQCVCSACEVVRKSWGKGRIEVRELCLELAQYLTGYCLKKLVRSVSPEGLEPEFVRMSLRPSGIGAVAMQTVSDHLSPVRAAGVEFEDVPTALAHGRRMLPLGRYLRRKLREALDFEEVGAQPGWEVRKVLEARAAHEACGSTAEWRRVTDEARNQAALNVETIARIRASRRKL